MKSSATAQQDSSGPYSVWCRNCCEGHRQIISCHYCAPGKGVKRSTKASGGGVDPTTKQSRISQEPTWAWPEPPCRWRQAFQLLQDALSQTLVGALYSSAWLCHRACNKQAGWIQQALVWQGWGCLSKDCRLLKGVLFLPPQPRFAIESLSGGEERVIHVQKEEITILRCESHPDPGFQKTIQTLPYSPKWGNCWLLRTTSKKKMAFLNAYCAIRPPFPTPLFSPHLTHQAIFHSAACAQLRMPRANMTQCSRWTVLNKVHLKTSADTAQHRAWW